MHDALKIKIKSLAEEARIIRRAERRIITNATALRLRGRLEGAGIPKRSIHRIMRRAQSRQIRLPQLIVGQAKAEAVYKTAIVPEEQSKFISEFERRYASIHRHRTCEMRAAGSGQADYSVRADARASLLAYGFLRGRKFETMEQKSYSPPPLDRAMAIALRFSTEDQRIVTQRFAEWRQEADKWKHPHYKAANPNAAR